MARTGRQGRARRPTMAPGQSSLARDTRKLVCGGAPGGAAPYVIGRVRPEAVTLGNQEWPWAHGWPDRKGCPKGGLAPPPWRLPALHSPLGKTGKGKRPTRGRQEYG